MSTLLSSVTFPGSEATVLDCSEPEHPASRCAERAITTSHARIALEGTGDPFYMPQVDPTDACCLMRWI